MSSEKTKVLYLAGTARSGSTLLGRLFGQPQEAVHVGEMVYIWHRSFRDRHLCGCGSPFHQCPFWTEVFERGFGGFGGVDFEEILETKRRLERTRTLPRLLSPRKTGEETRRLGEYRRVLAILYGAVRETSGARVVVDGSKSETYGYVLDTVPELDVRALHLVRDSRAVAHSHGRRKPDPALRTAAGVLRTMPPYQAALLWNATNLLLTLKMPGSRRAVMRYEDAVADPEAALRRLWALVDEPAPALDFLKADTMRLRTNHTVAGNPDRFRADVRIRPDDEWRRKMSPRDRRLVTALTYPLLLHYGYLAPLPAPDEQAHVHPAGVL